MSDNILEFKKKETIPTQEIETTSPPSWETKISQLYWIYKPSQILSLLKHPRFSFLEVTKGPLKGAFLTNTIAPSRELNITSLPNTGEGAMYEQLFSMEEFVIELWYFAHEGRFRAQETFSFLDSPKEGSGFRSEGVKIWKMVELLSGKDEEIIHEHIWQSTDIGSLTELDLTDPKNRHPLVVYYHHRADFASNSNPYVVSSLMEKKTFNLTLPDKSFSVFVF